MATMAIIAIETPAGVAMVGGTLELGAGTTWSAPRSLTVTPRPLSLWMASLTSSQRTPSLTKKLSLKS